MSHGILQAALDEERRLIERLEAVRALIRTYTGDASAAVAVQPIRTDTSQIQRRSSEKNEHIRDAVERLLDGEEAPIPTRDILSVLESDGVDVGGKNPIATLSAILSHAPQFEAVGRSGWIMKSRTPDADTSGAASTGGDASPLFESQKERSPSD